MPARRRALNANRPARIALLLCTLLSTAQSQCVFNSTHCSCTGSSSAGLCLRYNSGPIDSATCLVDSCQSSGHKCDCAGPQVCPLKTCTKWEVTDPATPYRFGDVVACKHVEGISGGGSACVSRPMASPKPLMCPGGSPSFEVGSLFQTGQPADNTPRVTAYSATESISARLLTVEECVNPSGVTAAPGSLGFQVAPYWGQAPAGGYDLDPGYCILSGTGTDLQWNSFQAVILEASGFYFQPTSMSVFDVDNVQARQGFGGDPVSSQVCREAAAVFGIKDGVLVSPSVSKAAGSPLEVSSYSVPTSAMTKMGLSVPGGAVPGGQMGGGTAVDICQGENMGSQSDQCQLTWSFDSPIDTLVVMSAFASVPWPAGWCVGYMYMTNPVVQC